MLENLLFGDVASEHSGSAGRVLVGGPMLRFDIAALRTRLGCLRSGDCLAYAVRLDGGALTRLATLFTLRLRIRRVERAIERAGANVVGRYGVDPVLDVPAILYEMNSAAAAYADRCLRPRGSHQLLRRLIARSIGCDPALGALVVVARKR